MEPKKAYKTQFLSAWLFVVIVPILLVIATVWQINSQNQIVRKGYLNQGKQVAVTAAGLLEEKLDQPIVMIESLKQISDRETNIKEITVYKPSGTKLTAVASTLLAGGLNELADPNQIEAWTNNQATAILEEGNSNLVQAIAPIVSSSNQKLGLVVVRVAVNDQVTQVNRSTVISLIWLLVIVLVSSLLFGGVFFYSGYLKLYKELRSIAGNQATANVEAITETKTRLEHLKQYAEGLNNLPEGDLEHRQAYLRGIEQEVASLQGALEILEGKGTS